MTFQNVIGWKQHIPCRQSQLTSKPHAVTFPASIVTKSRLTNLKDSIHYPVPHTTINPYPANVDNMASS